MRRGAKPFCYSLLAVIPTRAYATGSPPRPPPPPPPRDPPSSSPSSSLANLFTASLTILKKSIDIQLFAYEKANQSATEIMRRMGHKMGPSPSPSHPSEPLRSPLGSPPTASAGGGTAGDVSPSVKAHIESLFKELEQRRQRIQELQLTLDDARAEQAKMKTKLSAVMASEDNVKEKLREATARYDTKADEVLTLKEKERDLKLMTQKLHQAQSEIVKLKEQSSPEAQENASLEALRSQLSMKETEVERLRKKIERLRTQSPGLVAIQSVVALMGSVQSDYDKQGLVAEAYQSLLQKYAVRLSEEWALSHARQIGAPLFVVRACAEFIRLSLMPCAMLDVTLTSPHDIPPEAARALEERFGFVRDGRMWYNKNQSKMGLGPFGVMYCLAKSYGLTLTPTIHPKNERVELLYETSRASGPGGQAVNVTETHVAVVLKVDGVVLARSEAGDTRSQGDNRKIATERLWQEKVPKELQRLGDSLVPWTPFVLSKEQAQFLCQESFFEELSEVEKLLVRAVLVEK